MFVAVAAKDKDTGRVHVGLNADRTRKFTCRMFSSCLGLLHRRIFLGAEISHISHGTQISSAVSTEFACFLYIISGFDGRSRPIAGKKGGGYCRSINARSHDLLLHLRRLFLRTDRTRQ